MAYGFYYGYNKGIISTMFTMAGYLLGIIFAFKAIPLTSALLERILNNDHPMMSVAAFIVNLGVVMFVLRFVSNALMSALNAVYLGFVNRILGGVVMALFGALIFSVLLWFATKAQFINQSTLDGSMVYRPLLEPLPGKAKNVLVRFKPLITEAWGESMQWMDKVEEFGEEKEQANEPRIYELPDDGADIDTDPYETAPRRPADDGDGIEYE
jgi:membrane protein required for colicin V production